MVNIKAKIADRQNPLYILVKNNEYPYYTILHRVYSPISAQVRARLGFNILTRIEINMTGKFPSLYRFLTDNK